MNTLEELLKRAISKAKSRDDRTYLAQDEYDMLIKWSKISGADGREACNAIATAKKYDYTAFRDVRSRDNNAEENYGKLGKADY